MPCACIICIIKKIEQMGFTVAAAALLAANKSLLKGKRILSLGNPFGAETTFLKYLETSQINKIAEQPRDLRARYLFMEIFEAQDFKVLDISAEEGADYVIDLNYEIILDELKEAFHIVLDLGTQEHVFNDMIFIKNVFRILTLEGTYFFDLPSNNWCEHGFRQFSPTFFYDLCSTNHPWLQISHLSLWTKDTYLNALPLYEKLDPNFSKSFRADWVNVPPRMISSGMFTGMAIQLFNKINSPANVIGVIIKSHSSRHQLDLAAMQCLYRNFPLSSILPNSKLHQSLMQKSKQAFKSVTAKILFTTLPAWLAIRVLSLIAM
jgi:hypothetical protein